MKQIISSKRIARHEGGLIGFNKNKTAFYRLIGPITPRSHQALQGGIECEQIFPDATERELILMAWRAGKANDLLAIEPHRILQQD